MAKAAAFDSADNAGVKIVPPLLYIAVFAAAWLAQRLLPLPVLRSALPGFAGAALVAAGAALALGSVGLFHRKHTSVVPIKPSATLVLTGPYRFTRNPMYLGLLVVYVGWALILQLLWALILAPALVVAVHRLVIQKEEQYLLRRFGADYRAYEQRVRRWI